MIKREDTRQVNPPDEAGRIVNMIEHGGTIWVACEHMVLRLVDGELKPIEFSVCSDCRKVPCECNFEDEY